MRGGAAAWRRRADMKSNKPSGKVDHIPATIFAGYSKLTAVYDAVREHPGVNSWYAKA